MIFELHIGILPNHIAPEAKAGAATRSGRWLMTLQHVVNWTGQVTEMCPIPPYRASTRWILLTTIVCAVLVACVGTSTDEQAINQDPTREVASGESVESDQSESIAEDRDGSQDSLVDSVRDTEEPSQTLAGPPPWREHGEPWANDSPPPDHDNPGPVRPGGDIEEWMLDYEFQLGDYAAGAPSAFVGVVTSVKPVFEPMNRHTMHTVEPIAPADCRGRLIGGLEVEFEAVETIRGESLPERFTLKAGSFMLRAVGIENLYLEADEFGAEEPTWWVYDGPDSHVEDNGRRGFRPGQRVGGFAGQVGDEVLVAPQHLFEVLEDDSVRWVGPERCPLGCWRPDPTMLTLGFEEAWRAALTAPMQDHEGAQALRWSARSFFEYTTPQEMALTECSEFGVEDGESNQE